MKPDVRWKQRFQNFQKALAQLKDFVDQDSLNNREEQGLIQAFEYTFELAWKVLQDLLKDGGYTGQLMGSIDTIRGAFEQGWILNGEAWMAMLKDRNNSVHSYNEETADQIVEHIFETYYNEYVQLETKLSAHART